MVMMMMMVSPIELYKFIQFNGVTPEISNDRVCIYADLCLRILYTVLDMKSIEMKDKGT